MEDLVQAVAARMHLKWVGEQDENGDGELADGDEERCRGVHCNDIGTDVATKGEVAEYSYDFVGDRRGADGAAHDGIHPRLRVGLDLVEDREEL